MNIFCTNVTFVVTDVTFVQNVKNNYNCIQRLMFVKNY